MDTDTLFFKHPREKNMTYKQHFKHAIKHSAKLLCGSICLGVHAFIPYYFETKGSDIVKELNDELTKK